MKNAIILCAGSARRFYTSGENQPKCLLPLVDDQTILDRLLQAVLSRGYSAILGTGCGHDQVSLHIERFRTAPISCVYNAEYATTNSIVTLWRLRDYVRDDSLLINGDLVIGDAAFDLFQDSGEPQLLVRASRSFDSDTYRVVFEDEYSIQRMGKDLDDPPSPNCFAYTGISRVGNAELFLGEIEKLVSNGVKGTWPTTAYANLIGEIPIRAVDIGSTLCFDVDTPEEHRAAQQYLSEYSAAAR